MAVQFYETLFWLQQGEERLRVLGALTQPLTANQIALRIGKSRTSVSEHIRQMRIYQLLTCLNPSAHQSRVYWLTDDGKLRRTAVARGDEVLECPDIDWDLYGDLCFRHRRTVLLTLNGRMRPPLVKKRALANDPRLRMSVDNCREVLYWMQSRGVVRSIRPRGRRFALYELTGVGGTCQHLMRQALMPTAA